MTSAALRNTAFASAALAAATLASLVPNSARAANAEISQGDCKTIAAVIYKVTERAKIDTLSSDFVLSLSRFLRTGDVDDCKGARDIMTPLTRDVAVFNVIREVLLSGPRPISLQKLGLRSLDPAKLASERPDAMRGQVGGTTPAPRG